MKVLVTGSSGLIGSEAVLFYEKAGHRVFGLDNNMRSVFFGEQGDTLWNLKRLQSVTKKFFPESLDIRNREALFDLFKRHRFDFIIHCAAQPSHDRAAQIPTLDFEVNALGTLNLLEAFRQFCPEAVFVFMSTNKVYGDAPNELPLIEKEQRYEYAREQDFHGIDEHCRIDQSLHSLFGASKAAADLLAQEYGRYFGLKVGIFRGGCLTGPQHSSVQLHGFLSYLVKCAVRDIPYTIFGYKGKQVRDQLHSSDVIRAFDAFFHNPHPGEPYNLGGGRQNSASVTVNGRTNVTLFNKACADRVDKQIFFIGAENQGDHHLNLQPEDTPHIEVETAPLDDMLTSSIDKIDLIKMDIQGAEPLAFRGMRKIIHKNPSLIIIVEFAPFLLDRCGSSGDEFLRDIANMGFAISLIDEKEKIVKEVDNASLIRETSGRRYVNLLLRRNVNVNSAKQ